ncbi:helix-turn-helix domain-containing protein [Streptomyces sp. NBC_01579]|uniref:helix-turn-helix domain-containing protein n=1 Tax=unclassified Streptomyces TaxID=2593676 RepID=UPI00386F669D|nr:LuxR C-terminal-related transcriptional regulator [Streptomyces sp. NBC_01643]WTD38852.1 LuxR C-terminal-related transcriptional regulator [Streptomyces sp. NBC_01643]WTF25001.1 LuxR C-terminal-related transcriptional regulator [Streptomyces sp. NBC_01602]
MLEAAGLTSVEETVYRLLVMTSTASADEIASQTGLALNQVESVLAALTVKGLANRSDRNSLHFTASPPDVALLPRLQRRAEALDLARASIADLLESYRSTRRHQADHLIEVITGAGALRQHLRQLQDNARHEMLWFCKAQYVAMPSGSNRAEFEALARGVRYRVLYERAFFNDHGAVDNVISGVRAGELARSVPHLPLRLAIADREIAICPLVPGGPHGSPNEPTAALLRDSSLLEAMTALFERHWEDAAPLHLSDSGTIASADDTEATGVLPEADRRLLSLLVAGLADKSIAGQMGLSRRTVQRRIQHMMAVVGATTRMQLAWHATRRGWV